MTLFNGFLLFFLVVATAGNIMFLFLDWKQGKFRFFELLKGEGDIESDPMGTMRINSLTAADGSLFKKPWISFGDDDYFTPKNQTIF